LKRLIRGKIERITSKNIIAYVAAGKQQISKTGTFSKQEYLHKY